MEAKQEELIRYTFLLTNAEYYYGFTRKLQKQGLRVVSIRGLKYDKVKKQNSKIEIICEKVIKRSYRTIDNAK